MITIVVPIWDAYCRKLRACVDDLLQQDGDHEILVVDNASTAPLPELPQGVRTFRLDRRATVGAARNAAMAHVTTPFVLFADADDRLLPGTVAFLVSELRARPEIVAAVVRHLHWDPETDTRTETNGAPRPIVYRLAPLRSLLALCTLRFNIFPIVGCAAVRADAVRASGGFGDGNVAEDWELCAALAWRGPIGFYRRPGRLYAVEEGSLWHRRHSREEFEERYDAFRRRLFADPAVPMWARALRPIVAALHRHDLNEIFRDGAYHPRPRQPARKVASGPPGSAQA
jgi:glycosyltransferase involved in cell wall biosynthesis